MMSLTAHVLAVQPPPVPSFHGLARKLEARVSTAPLTIPEDFELRTSQRGARKSVLPQVCCTVFVPPDAAMPAAPSDTPSATPSQEPGDRSPYVKSMASKVQDYYLRNSPQAKRTSTKRPRASRENAEPQVAAAHHHLRWTRGVLTHCLQHSAHLHTVHRHAESSTPVVRTTRHAHSAVHRACMRSDAWLPGRTLSRGRRTPAPWLARCRTLPPRCGAAAQASQPPAGRKSSRGPR
jgi:hypothetical protein